MLDRTAQARIGMRLAGKRVAIELAILLGDADSHTNTIPQKDQW